MPHFPTWEPPILDSNSQTLDLDYVQESSLSPLSNPPYTPQDGYMNPHGYPYMTGGQEMTNHDTQTMTAAFPVITTSWVDFYADILCTLWFRDQAYDSVGDYIRHSPLKTSGQPFKNFTQNIIGTTALSQAVLVLSLWYIDRLRRLNGMVKAAPGSEYRLCATSLMLANKYLDDNTYTSKTWSTMTGIPLQEMNLMEVEFLASLQHRMGISDNDYVDWFGVLNQVAAEARDQSLAKSFIAPSDYAFTFQHPISPSYHGLPMAVACNTQPPSPLYYQPGLSAPCGPPQANLSRSASLKRSTPDSSTYPSDRPSRRVKTNYDQAQHGSEPLTGAMTHSASAHTYNLVHEDTNTSSSYATLAPPVTDQSYTNPQSLGYVPPSVMNLHLPWDYRSGFQAKPEDLSFYTLTASPIEDEWVRFQNDYYSKMGKPRVLQQGQYQYYHHPMYPGAMGFNMAPAPAQPLTTPYHTGTSYVYQG